MNATPTSAPSSSSVHTVFRAEGFSCPSCVAKIERQVGRLDGVDQVTVKFASGRVEVDHDPARASSDAIVAAIAKAGYQASPASF